VDPTPIVNGIDARLIEAEAKIATNDFAGMTAILNALRAAPQNLGVLTTPVITPALAAPATKAAALDQFFREKAFWTYSRGQRLGDLRRLIRQYGRTQDNVFPTGTFFKGGNYGTDVNFPVHVDEQNNPEFKGCADRAA
jgi:starch-binding outer membrane protein, SusD/RagB family